MTGDSAMKREILVIGGGPAGMAASIAAAEKGANVTLLERRSKPGKKLLATGNGRCNLAHTGKPKYFGDKAFADQVFSVCSPESVMRQFETWGLKLYTDPEGRVYPATQQAASVLSVLSARMKQNNVNIILGSDVSLVRINDHKYEAVTADAQVYTADHLILATGGLAGGGLGNRTQDYTLATGLLHHMTNLFAGLAPLETELGRLKRLNGLRLPARAEIVSNGQSVASTAGEILFTEYGLSGICIMQLARDAQVLLGQGKEVEICLDLSPVFFPELRKYMRNPEKNDQTYQRTVDCLKAREKNFGRKGMLIGLVPDALAAVCPIDEIHHTADFLTSMRMRVKGVRPMAQAQITCGGIDTKEVNPHTMESLICPGMYLAGEMLNVDGDCGGYNLQFAFATGLIAGHSAAL